MRHWCFSVEDWNGSVFYLDEYGQHIDAEDARRATFQGDQRDAETEADRRTMLWESRTKADAARIVMHSSRWIPEGAQQ